MISFLLGFMAGVLVMGFIGYVILARLQSSIMKAVDEMIRTIQERN